MTAADSPLPKDAETLAAMLIAERAAHAAETERLHQIIKALQRHRFGRRAETLPVDQLELALEDVEQVEGEADAAAESAAPEKGTVRNFVFGPGIMGKKEISHGPTQRAVDI
jgi:transposase